MAVIDRLEVLPFKKLRDGVIELLVAPAIDTVKRMESLHPTGGGEGALCGDLAILVIDDVSDEAYTSVPHGAS